jgi:DNA-binding transcriptional regulator YiaG
MSKNRDSLPKTALIKNALRQAADIQEQEGPHISAGSDSESCPECEERDLETRSDVQEFVYGEGSDAVKLSAVVPVRSCRRCGFEFLDASAEDARHDAVCRHLGVRTPAEVKAIRLSHRKSRSEFAAISGIGEASLGRWESGALIQSSAYDKYLQLLSKRSNLQELETIANTRQERASTRRAVSARRTVALENVDAVRARGTQFSLSGIRSATTSRR